jgi:hypothetical protein
MAPGVPAPQGCVLNRNRSSPVKLSAFLTIKQSAHLIHALGVPASQGCGIYRFSCSPPDTASLHGTFLLSVSNSRGSPGATQLHYSWCLPGRQVVPAA